VENYDGHLKITARGDQQHPGGGGGDAGFWAFFLGAGVEIFPKKKKKKKPEPELI